MIRRRKTDEAPIESETFPPGSLIPELDRERDEEQLAISAGCVKGPIESQSMRGLDDENAKLEWCGVIDRRTGEMENGKVSGRLMEEVLKGIRKKLNANRNKI